MRNTSITTSSAPSTTTSSGHHVLTPPSAGAPTSSTSAAVEAAPNQPTPGAAISTKNPPRRTITSTSRTGQLVRNRTSASPKFSSLRVTVSAPKCAASSRSSATVRSASPNAMASGA